MSTGSGDNSAPAPTTHDSQTSTDSPRNSSMFSSLKIRNYRLFFLGQDFLYAITSATLPGECRDARYLAARIPAPVSLGSAVAAT